MKTVSLISFGCKVNQYETHLLRENLEREGYKSVDEGEIFVINTCCVTGKVEKEIRRIIRKKLREGREVWVTGCLVNKSPEDLKVQFPSVKIFDKNEFITVKTISNFNSHTRAFIKIEDGCENYCSYCIIPYVRGKVKSRDEEEIVEEIRKLVKNGYKEIVLTGIDLGAYGKDTGTSFISLLKKIFKIEGLRRVRLSSIELIHLSDEIINFLAEWEVFCPHFHIPLQSGSNRILKLMNRKYGVSEYIEKIEKIRERINKVTFTTDIMVGFPGEKEKDFIETCEIVEKIQFLKIHIFPYSPREKTSAYHFPDKISCDVKKEREYEIFKVGNRVSYEVKKKFLGKTFQVLVERKKDGYWEGYSENYIPFIIESEKYLKNEVVSVMAEKIEREKFLYFKDEHIPNRKGEKCLQD